MSGSYDHWKTTNPDDEFLGPEPPEELNEDDYQDALDNPCSDLARKFGCTCRMSTVRPTDIDPPEPVISRDCRLHGKHDYEDRIDE